MPMTAQESLSSVELLTTDAQQRLDKSEFNLVLAGTEQIPVATSPATVPLTRGVAILLIPAQHGLFGDHGFSTIVDDLNSWGWFTLVMPAPPMGTAPPENIALPDDINARSALSSFNEEVLTRYALALSQRIDAAFAATQATPGYRLLITQGINAAGVVRLYQQGSLLQPDGLVVAGPFWPEPELNAALPEQLASTAFPVLDLTSEWDNRWSVMTAEQRRISAVTSLKIHYRQRDIVGTEYNVIQYRAMSKEMYGWMTSLGW
ncbi:DUF3530 family protein [Alteromonas sp. ASW11-36]|uniref:DUF3530 family protein n=1 Tax=Alteromonas arenosi TaxID=3055817 RepID=A0ABT7SZS2_9ALTE|nr:DUF3530 family protein [Alteromonas sp. ASW11-36]MDM7861685.1 DUF3530 family protein [Alteromonas sp. ASW11-36]